MKSLFLIIAVAFSSYVNAQKVKDLSVNEVESMIKSNKSLVVVDLRTTDELKEYGTIENSVQIDYFAKDFEKQLLSLDKKKTYLLYCASGARSSEAVSLLQKNGFENIFHFPGGFNAWRKAKKPITLIIVENI